MNDFRLSQKQADKLIATYRKEQAAALTKLDGRAYEVWAYAIELLHEAQMSAFSERASRKSQPLDLKPAKDA